MFSFLLSFEMCWLIFDLCRYTLVIRISILAQAVRNSDSAVDSHRVSAKVRLSSLASLVASLARSASFVTSSTRLLLYACWEFIGSALIKEAAESSSAKSRVVSGLKGKRRMFPKIVKQADNGWKTKDPK